MEKKEKYELLLQQVESLVDGEKNEVGVLANVTAAIARWHAIILALARVCAAQLGNRNRHLWCPMWRSSLGI